MRKGFGWMYIIVGIAGLALDVMILTAFSGSDPVGGFLFMLFIAAPITGPIAVGSFWLIGMGLAAIASTKIWP